MEEGYRLLEYCLQESVIGTVAAILVFRRCHAFVHLAEEFSDVVLLGGDKVSITVDFNSLVKFLRVRRIETNLADEVVYGIIIVACIFQVLSEVSETLCREIIETKVVGQVEGLEVKVTVAETGHLAEIHYVDKFHSEIGRRPRV